MNKRKAPITVYILTSLFVSCLSIVSCSSESSSSDSPSITDQKPIATAAQKSANSQKSQLSDTNVVSFLREYATQNSENEVVIFTRMGEIHIELFANTPIHRANFIYLTKKKYFDDTWFYRVSPGHVIQAGNTDQKVTVEKRDKLGNYTLPNEIGKNLHVYGSVAAARSYYQNPDKRSSPYEFYIVLGKSYSTRELELLAEKEGFLLTERMISAYTNSSGAPHLDDQHTVFGRVTRGMEVVEAINRVETDVGEWPIEEIPIKVALKPAS